MISKMLIRLFVVRMAGSIVVEMPPMDNPRPFVIVNNRSYNPGGSHSFQGRKTSDIRLVNQVCSLGDVL